MSSENSDETPTNSSGKLSLSLACEKQATVKHSVSFAGRVSHFTTNG